MLVKFSMSVTNRSNLVEKGAWSVTTFHGIGIAHIEMSIEDHPSTTLFRKILVLVFGVHVVFTENTVEVFKFYAVHWEKFGK